MKKLNILFFYQFSNEKSYLTKLSDLIKTAGASQGYETIIEIKPLSEILLTEESYDLLFVRAGSYKNYLTQIKKWVGERTPPPMIVITEPIQSKEAKSATDGMLYVVEPNIEKVSSSKDKNNFEKVFQALFVTTG